MDALLLVVRLILAAVLLLSGALKLVDRDGSRETFEGVGVPDMVARPLVWLLPSVELVVGLLVCVPATARLASAAAVVLLAGYTVVVWRLVRRGGAVACHCFGALSREPVSYRTLVRNLVLLALALLGAVGQVDGYWTSWQWVREAPPATDVALVVSTAALGTTAWLAALALKLMRRNGELLQAAGDSGILSAAARPPSGPGGNTVALEFDLPDAGGESWTLDRLVKPGRHLALVSVDPNCGPCRALLPELATWLGRNDGSPLDVVLLSGDAAATVGECSSNGVHVPVLAADRQTLAAYGLSATPAVVVVGPDRRFKAGPAGGRTAVLELLDRLVAMRGVPHGQAGLPDKLPALPVTDAGGRQVLLPAQLRRRTLVVFWRSTCGFCQRMVGDVEAWSALPRDESGIDVLVVAADDDTVRQFSLQVRVLLDRKTSVARALGVMGTPSAVLVNADGRLVSKVASGQGNVAGLIRHETGEPERPLLVPHAAKLEAK